VLRQLEHNWPSTNTISLSLGGRVVATYDTIRYDTIIYVRSKADDVASLV